MNGHTMVFWLRRKEDVITKWYIYYHVTSASVELIDFHALARFLDCMFLLSAIKNYLRKADV